jgi:DNA-binding transcriptional LysR family regulator
MPSKNIASKLAPTPTMAQHGARESWTGSRENLVMQDLNDIHCFVQVVELGTFTAASRALGVAKSQLSFRVARLEANLGVRLIQRTTRRSHVTEIGRRYYEDCRALLAAAEQAQRVIDDAQAAPRGRIHVACPVMFAQLLLAPVLTAYLRRHPDVQVDLENCDHQADVVAGGYDIAFRVRESVKDSSLVMRSFGMDPQMLVASPALLERHAPPRLPKDLARLPSVGVLGTQGRHFWRLADARGRVQAVEHRPRLASDDLQVLYQAVTGGVGMAQLPAWLCREPVARGRLVPLLPNWSLPPGNVHAVYPSRHGHTPAVRSFIEFMARHLPQVLGELQRGARTGDVKPRPAALRQATA